MEQMEVTPVTLETDDNLSILDDSSNQTTIDHQYISNTNSVALQSVNGSSGAVLEEPALGLDTCSDNACPKFIGSNLTETSAKLSIASTREFIQDKISHNPNKSNTEIQRTVIDGHDGKSNTDAHTVDELCASGSIYGTTSEQNTECFKMHVPSILYDTEAHNSSFVHLDNSLHNKNDLNENKTCTDDPGVEIEEQLNGTNKDKAENDLMSSDIGRKQCDLSSSNLQHEPKQQSSEIKERVMGFLTKYTNVEDTSCRSQVSNQTNTKEFEEGKYYDMNESNIDSRIVNEEQHDLNPRKSSNCSIAENSDLGFESYVKFMFHNGAKSDRMTTQEFLPVQGLSVISTQTSDKNDLNKVDSECSVYTSNLHTESLSPISVSSRCEVVCNPKNTDAEMDSPQTKDIGVSETDAFIFQQAHETTLDNSELEIPHNFNQFSVKSLVKSDMSMCDTHSTEAKESSHLSELNADVLVPNSPLNCSNLHNNTFVENRMSCDSSLKNAVFSSPPHTVYGNDTSLSSQRNNSNIPVNLLFTSWEKISFQPHTTPSINSPIFSSKSSNEHSLLKCTVLSEDEPICNLQTDNAVSGSFLWSPKSGSNSRRTKSSDAMFCSKPTCSRGSTLLNNINKPLFCGKTGEALGTNFSEFSALGCGTSSSTVSAFPEKNMKQTCTMLGDHFGKAINLSNTACYGSPLASGPFKGIADNPFTKKSPVQSIGLFNSPVKSAIDGIGKSSIKPVPPSLTFFPSKREKIGELVGVPNNSDKAGLSQYAVSTNNSQFVFKSDGNKQDQTMNTTKEFVFGNICDQELSNCTEKAEFNCGQTTSDSNNKQTPFVNSIRVPAQISGNTIPFHFTLNPEKKSSCVSRSVWPRLIKKPIKTNKQHDRVFLKCMKENNNASNITKRDSEDIPFKPVYGSDIKMEKGMNKNIFVRYQNIVFMDEYGQVSPEELRTQFYAKTAVSGPFKFSASTESKEHHSYKKTQNQGIQTDEHLAYHKPDLAGIWRVLECPVCLDVVLPPVYQCEQGHHACLNCWNKVVTCPLCKRHKSGTRNYMAEALVEQVPLPCRYHIEGCKETVQHMNKVSHEETCSYRMYQCPVFLCKQAHSYQNMCKHFNKLHKTLLHHEGHSVGKGEKFCDVLYKEVLSLSLVHAFDITKWGLFFLREVSVHNSTALFVQVMPATSDQAAYFYHLEVCDHHDCRKECYKGRVFPLGKATQEIIDQEEYLCLSELIMKTVKKTTPLKIVVTIWQLKVAFTLSTE